MFRLPTFPEANEFEIEPRFTAASPPSVVKPVVPAAPVTSPVANAFVIVPLLEPTSPPPLPFDPTLTAPVAQVWPATQGWVGVGAVVPAIVPKFVATKPPAVLPVPPCTSPVAKEERMVPVLLPTKPPA